MLKKRISNKTGGSVQKKNDIKLKEGEHITRINQEVNPPLTPFPPPINQMEIEQDLSDIQRTEDLANQGISDLTDDYDQIFENAFTYLLVQWSTEVEEPLNNELDVNFFADFFLEFFIENMANLMQTFINETRLNQNINRLQEIAPYQGYGEQRLFNFVLHGERYNQMQLQDDLKNIMDAYIDGMRDSYFNFSKNFNQADDLDSDVFDNNNSNYNLITLLDRDREGGFEVFISNYFDLIHDYLTDYFENIYDGIEDDNSEYSDSDNMSIASRGGKRNRKITKKNCCNHNKKDKKCTRKVDGKKFKLPRKFPKKKCINGPVKGFTMKASCAPYLNCKTKGGNANSIKIPSKEDILEKLKEKKGGAKEKYLKELYNDKQFIKKRQKYIGGSEPEKPKKPSQPKEEPKVDYNEMAIQYLKSTKDKDPSEEDLMSKLEINQRNFHDVVIDAMSSLIIDYMNSNKKKLSDQGIKSVLDKLGPTSPLLKETTKRMEPGANDTEDYKHMLYDSFWEIKNMIKEMSENEVMMKIINNNPIKKARWNNITKNIDNINKMWEKDNIGEPFKFAINLDPEKAGLSSSGNKGGTLKKRKKNKRRKTEKKKN